MSLALITRRAIALLGVASVALAVLAGPAAAKRGYSVEPRGIEVTASLNASHGYNLSLAANAGEPLRVVVSKGFSTARYTVPARVTRNGIKANLGKLGRISLRFTPIEARRVIKEEGCKGRRAIRKSGRFDGVIRFHGELGYTSATARSVQGSVTRNFRLVCKVPPFFLSRDRRLLARPAKRHRLMFTAMTAISKTRGHTSSFEDFQLEEENAKGAFTITVSARAEKRGRISIARSAATILGYRVVSTSPVGEQPVTAKVKGPKPLHGVGSYLGEAGKPPSWTGNFSVSLPGANVVPLTGRGFEVGLCFGFAESEKNARCLSKLKQLTESAQSGSNRTQASKRISRLLSRLR